MGRVKRETKLFPRLPKFQPSATHHLRHPPSATPSKYPSRSLTSVAHPKLPQFQAPATHSPPSPTFSSPLSSPLSHSPSPSLACPSPVPHQAPGSIQRPPQTHPTCPSSSPRPNSLTRNSPSPRLDQEQPHRPLACSSSSPANSTPPHTTCISYRYSSVCN